MASVGYLGLDIAFEKRSNLELIAEDIIELDHSLSQRCNVTAYILRICNDGSECWPDSRTNVIRDVDCQVESSTGWRSVAIVYYVQWVQVIPKKP